MNRLGGIPARHRVAAFLLAPLCALLIFGQANGGALGLDLLVKVELSPGADYVVMDVLDGVEARYRPIVYNDVYGAYSCAGYVKAYYEAVYGVDVQNLTDAGPPLPSEHFIRVETPQKGDIIFFPSPPNTNNHSAIVKAFDGNQIVLIEQNYKFVQGDSTYTYLNRTLSYPPDNQNMYEIWRLAFVPDNEPEEPSEPLSPPPSLPDTSVNPPVTPPVNAPADSIPMPTLLYKAVVTIGRMSIAVNDVDMPIDAPALIENNRTVMPVRWVSFALGLTTNDLHWDADARTVTVYNKSDVIMFTIDSEVLYINGVPTLMDCPASIKSDRAYLPVRFLADALGVSFTWDAEQGSATFYRFAE